VVILVPHLRNFAVFARDSIPPQVWCTLAAPIVFDSLVWMMRAEILTWFRCGYELLGHAGLSSAIDGHFLWRRHRERSFLAFAPDVFWQATQHALTTRTQTPTKPAWPGPAPREAGASGLPAGLLGQCFSGGARPTRLSLHGRPAPLTRPFYAWPHPAFL
jgi:hypothetical protein